MLGLLSDSFMLAARMDGFSYLTPSSGQAPSQVAGAPKAAARSRSFGALRRALAAMA